MNFPKIDLHTHIIPEDWSDFSSRFGNVIGFRKTDSKKGQLLKSDGTVFREIESNCWDPLARLDDCDKVGVGVQVLSTIPVLFNYHLNASDALITSRFINDHLSRVVKSEPRRFVGFGTVPLQDSQLAIQELERCIGLGLVGVEIGTNVNGDNLDEERLFPFWEACERLDVPVFVHPWEMVGSNRMTRYWLPWLVGMPAELNLAISSMVFGGIFEKFPKLRVAFAHGGGSFCFHLGRLQKGFEARPDLCAVKTGTPPKDSLGKFWVDSLLHSPDALKFVVEKLGAEKVMLGSDYPFPLGEDSPGKMISEMGFSEDVVQKLFFGSAKSFLGSRIHLNV